MVQCEILKVIKVIKWSLHFGLFIAFIVLTSIALLDLISNKTTFHISNQYENQVLPSLTLCTKGDFAELKRILLANNSATFWSDWATFNISIKFEDGELVTFDPNLGGHYASLEHYIKSDPDMDGNYLLCITLNIDNIKERINWSDVSLFPLLDNCTSK